MDRLLLLLLLLLLPLPLLLVFLLPAISPLIVEQQCVSCVCVLLAGTHPCPAEGTANQGSIKPLLSRVLLFTTSSSRKSCQLSLVNHIRLLLLLRYKQSDQL